MQISKTDFEKMKTEIDYLTRELQDERVGRTELFNQVQNFDKILYKIFRAARGLPLDLNPNNGMSPDYYGGQTQGHECNPRTPTEIEDLRWQLGSLREVCINLESQLAAVKAIAEFAKEHKA